MHASPARRPRLALRRPFQHWVSIVTSQICIMLFLAVLLTMDEKNISHADAVSRWGGMGSGLEVWRGEWWRIWVTQLHHADLLHLVGNLWCLLFFGRIMEHRMPKSQYLLFLLASAGFGGVLQTAIGPLFVGISGVISAQFGWIVAERDRDARLRRQFHDRPIFWFVAILLLGIPLEWFDVMPLGNAAHLGGAVFGMLWGMSRGILRSPALRTSARLAALLLLIPAVQFVTHPAWNPDYYWALADHSRSFAQRISYLEQGIAQDPHHVPLRQELALAYFQGADFTNAWDAALSAVQTSPADEKTLRLAQMIGQSVLPDLAGLFAKRNPRSILVKHFGDQAPAWEKLLLNRSTLARTKPERPKVQAAPLPPES